MVLLKYIFLALFQKKPKLSDDHKTMWFDRWSQRYNTGKVIHRPWR